MSSVGRTLVLLMIGGVVLSAREGLIAQGPPQDATSRHQAELALQGYCPVCLIEQQQWVPGNPEHEVVYDGHRYRFPGDQQKQMFLANPAKYVPALHGDCIVCLAKMNKRTPGNLRYGRFYDGRVFFFPNQEMSRMFAKNPSAFAEADLALDGRCAVCRVEMGKNVAGKPEYTVHHNGLRYQFPSAKQMKMFQANPEQYAVSGPASEPGTTEGSGPAQPPVRPSEGSGPRASAEPGPSGPETIEVSGRTTCAGCEHGVQPLGASDQLGLAINTEDGRVIVVQGAHQRYPDLYESRFDEIPVQLTGTVLKREGSVAWVEPRSLTPIRR